MVYAYMLREGKGKRKADTVDDFENSEVAQL
jgi:hypothetical protein